MDALLRELNAQQPPTRHMNATTVAASSVWLGRSSSSSSAAAAQDDMNERDKKQTSTCGSTGQQMATMDMVQFLRAKVIDRDRQLFEMRKQFDATEERCHEYARELRRLKHSSQGALEEKGLSTSSLLDRSEPHHHHHQHHPMTTTTTTETKTMQLLRHEQSRISSTSRLIIRALLDRVDLVQEAMMSHLSLRDAMCASLRRQVLLLEEEKTQRQHQNHLSGEEVVSGTSALSSSSSMDERRFRALLDTLRSLEMQKAKLQADVSRSERLVASALTESKKAQNDANEERIRSDILQHRVEQLSRSSTTVATLQGELDSLKDLVEKQNRELDASRRECNQLRRQLGDQESDWKRKYAEVLQARDGLLAALNEARMQQQQHQANSSTAISPGAAAATALLESMFASPPQYDHRSGGGAASSSSSIMASPSSPEARRRWAANSVGPMRLQRASDQSHTQHNSVLINPYRRGM